MSDFLRTVVTPAVSPRDVLLRLLGAFVLGWIVAWVHRRTRPAVKNGSSMQPTLVLLSILIATVTQVVGESPARAFSLVGALSIIRFRTVVQDTRDTAFVIFAVVMGMAAGAGAVWMALIGLTVISAAAFVIEPRGAQAVAVSAGHVLKVRTRLGHEAEQLLKTTLDKHLVSRRLLSMETAKQGTAMDATYDIQIRPDGSSEALVNELNHLEGVQNVQLQKAGFDDDDD